MSPRGYMWLGTFILAFCVAITFLGDYPPAAVFMTFGAGALFGKGYGIWEERCRPAKLEEGNTE